MHINNHIQALKLKHDELKRKIKSAYLYLKDDIELQRLKKEKLLLKEKIQLLLLQDKAKQLT